MLAVIYGIMLSINSLVYLPVTDLADTVKSKNTTNHILPDTTGRYLEFNRVFLIGNRRTRDNIIVRELTLKKGDIIYSLDLPPILENDKRKIFNLHLFNSVEIRTLEIEDNKFDLIIQVSERWYTFPIPRFKLTDRNINEWWQNYNHDFNRVNYGIKLYQYNFRGRNETLFFTAEFGFQKQFRLLYRIPYIDKKQKQGLTFEMDFFEGKNVAYRTLDHKLEFIKSENLVKNSRGIGLTYTFRNSYYRKHLFKYEYRDTDITDTLLRANPRYLENDRMRQSYDAISYQFISDNRDVAAYPLKGHNLTLHVQKHGVTLTDDLDKTEGWLSYARFFTLTNKSYLSNFSIAYASTPNKLPYLNFGVMGYNKIFVRGYELYVIEGPNFVLNKTTFKKQIFSHLFRWEKWPIEQFRHVPLAVYLKTYADFGYVQNYPNYEQNSRLTNKPLAGGGFGLDFVSSYDMVLRFEYTFTSEKTSGFFFHVTKEF